MDEDQTRTISIYSIKRVYSNIIIAIFFVCFQGTARKTGETVAIKTFDFIVDDIYIEREAMTLRKCNHKNIIKFLGLELQKDVAVDRKIMAMEFCSGGSLQNLIDQNPNGISSSEFFQVVEDLVNATEHLNKLNLVHRDIKPDNILIFKCSNGNSMFKLGDFGAARVLMPEQGYSSLYGTFEYVHPDIFANVYYAALDIAPPVNLFNRTYEWFSVGTTLYETATGRLPFRPKNGRTDKKIMYAMTSGLKDGQISATEGENGSIEWSSELPQNCVIDKKEKVQKFFAGLLKVRFYSILHQNYSMLCMPDILTQTQSHKSNILLLILILFFFFFLYRYRKCGRFGNSSKRHQN